MVYFDGLIYLCCCSRVHRTFGMAIETAMIMTIYLNEAMNKMVEKHGNSRKQLPRTSSDSTLLMALQKRLRPKLTVSVSLFGLVPILWSTGTGADVMIPITVPLIEEQSPCYICIISNYFFENKAT
jgi:Cu(I)/Ag(I) efflux system membrane protein CusA/SilA